jgi:hypothetical protein
VKPNPDLLANKSLVLHTLAVPRVEDILAVEDILVAEVVAVGPVFPELVVARFMCPMWVSAVGFHML